MIYPPANESLSINITSDNKFILEDGTESSDPLCLLKEGCSVNDT